MSWPAWGLWVVDGIIALTLLEGLALAWLHRRRGRGVAPREVAANLVSGLCLMLALRAALAGAGPAWVLAALSASGAVHAADLWRRWV